MSRPRDYRVRQRTYRVTPTAPDLGHRLVWRLDAAGVPNGIAGHIHRRSRVCWQQLPATKCWRSQEQAVIEVAKADEGVRR